MKDDYILNDFRLNEKPSFFFFFLNSIEQKNSEDGKFKERLTRIDEATKPPFSI
jgi:hypothetical protein